MNLTRFALQVAHAAAYGLLAYKLGTLAVNAVTMPRLSRQPRASAYALGRAAVLVPARNEARNLPHTLPSLMVQGAASVTVLDDHSTDATAQLAHSAGATVLTSQPLPVGWHGKAWACQQLAEKAMQQGAEVLVFTDADVSWQSGALEQALAYMHSSGADLLSVWPKQHNVALGERLLTPLVDHALLTLWPWPLLRLHDPRASVANGQALLLTRAAYLRLGGHAAVRAELLEDVALARAVTRGGGRVALILGGELLQVRMYRSYCESIEGFAKNLLSFHSGKRAFLPLTWGLHAVVYTVPYLTRHRLLIVLGLLEVLGARLLARRTAPADLAEALLTPLLPVLALPVYLRAAGREVTWKGRAYTQGAGGRIQGGTELERTRRSLE